MMDHEEYALLTAMQAHGLRLSKQDRAAMREYDQARCAFWGEFLRSDDEMAFVSELANMGRDLDLTKLFDDKPTDSQSTG